VRSLLVECSGHIASRESAIEFTFLEAEAADGTLHVVGWWSRGSRRSRWSLTYTVRQRNRI
jgi:hypothetical protein